MAAVHLQCQIRSYLARRELDRRVKRIAQKNRVCTSDKTPEIPKPLRSYCLSRRKMGTLLFCLVKDFEMFTPHEAKMPDVLTNGVRSKNGSCSNAACVKRD